MVTKRIKIPLFYGVLHIIITENLVEDLPVINKKYRNTLTEKDCNVLGMTEQRGSHSLILINLQKLEKHYKEGIEREAEIVATITHEAVHACNMIFKNKGLKLSLKNDETQAYLTDWITKEVYKVYFKYRHI